MTTEETAKPAELPDGGGARQSPDGDGIDAPRAGVPESLLKDQLAYYEARAAEYDQWFLRQGRYDRGAQLNRLWFDEVAQVQAALGNAYAGGDVLELACGTGLWTRQLVESARSITVIDGSSEMLAMHQRRIESPKIHRVQSDLFAWTPTSLYDFVFFGFWVSHVPSDRLIRFLSAVRQALRPEGRVFLVDSKYAETSTARDHHLAERDLGVQQRRLNDGRTYQIVKIFWRPEELIQHMNAAGLEVEVHVTDNYFIHACGSRTH